MLLRGGLIWNKKGFLKRHSYTVNDFKDGKWSFSGRKKLFDLTESAIVFYAIDF